MIYIDKKSDKPYYIQIYNNILNDILSGRIKAGTKLMGSRRLAEKLDISRNTVNSAYYQLLAEGYVESKKGYGYIVLDLPKLKPKENLKVEKRIEIENIDVSKDNIVFDLHYSNNLFPVSKWKKYYLDAIKNYNEIYMSRDEKGMFFLRENLKEYLYESRGVNCNVEQIIMTSGLQESLRIVKKLLFSNEDTIIIEDPCYSSAYSIFENTVNIESISIDRDGMKIPSKNTSVKAVYTTPSHQFPTGIVMSIKRRYELLKWARENESFIIEDDYDSEFTYYNKPIPALQSIDEGDRVIYLGTFSKSISPVIRMGYIILPEGLVDKYNELFKDHNNTVSLLDQYTVGNFIESGDYKRHIRKLSVRFKKNHELFIKGLKDINKDIKIYNSGAGIWILLEFPREYENLIEKAEKEGVRVYGSTGNWNQKDDGKNQILIGLAHIKNKDVEDCLIRLKRAWK